MVNLRDIVRTIATAQVGIQGLGGIDGPYGDGFPIQVQCCSVLGFIPAILRGKKVKISFPSPITTTVADETHSGYVYVVRPMRVFPDLCCLRWALIYAKHLNDFQFLDWNPSPAEKKMIETLKGITGWPK